MNNPRIEVQHGSCPGCGKPNSAIIGCYGWGHSLQCCSIECGERTGEIIKFNRRSKRYLSLKNVEYKTLQAIAREETKGLFPIFNHNKD